jgi:hypothetical protein
LGFVKSCWADVDTARTDIVDSANENVLTYLTVPLKAQLNAPDLAIINLRSTFPVRAALQTNSAAVRPLRVILHSVRRSSSASPSVTEPAGFEIIRRLTSSKRCSS